MPETKRRRKKTDPRSHLRGWRIVAENPAPEEIKYFESLLTLGNGFLGVRGSREEAIVSGAGWPLTLMAEVYDRPQRAYRLPATPKYRSPTRLAPIPGWLSVRFNDGSGWFPACGGRILSETFVLDMQRGTLQRAVRYKSPDGRITRLTTCRLVSQARPHVAALRYSIRPENYDGPVMLESMMDGAAAYPGKCPQTREQAKVVDGPIVSYVARTLQSRIDVALAARHTLSAARRPVEASLSPRRPKNKIGLVCRFTAARGRTYDFEKVVAFVSSLHEADPLVAARKELAGAPAFADLEAEHVRIWADYWRDADVRILGDPFVQTMARFFTFQLLQAASHHNVALGLSASIPAKTLSGPGYNGHIFWDTELYMLPFFSQQYPDIARSLLQYRIDRIEAARRNAAAVGAPGIKFPWQSADSGLEDTPKWIRSSVSGKIMRIVGGLRQIHINADVPMGFWQHYLATGDEDLLFGPALEILIQTARYWAGRITRVESNGALRYEIRKVMGPDEYHECIDNSVYTNAAARWNLLKAIDVLARAAASHPDRHAAVVRKFRLTDAELRQWEKIAGRLKINFDPRTGLYEEFDGFFAAPRIIKQPDVLLMLHLLPQMRTTEIFRKNFDLYHPITDHGSSLSPCMHVLFALDVGCRKKAYDYLVQVCEVDGIRRGNKTDTGLHAAALGGGWTAIVAGFGGVRVAPGALRVAPDLPKKWKRLEFSLRYRGLRLRFRIEPRRLRITADPRGPAVVLDLLGRRCRIRPGGQIVRRLPAR